MGETKVLVLPGRVVIGPWVSCRLAEAKKGLFDSDCNCAEGHPSPEIFLKLNLGLKFTEGSLNVT